MALITIILGLFIDYTFKHHHDLRDMTWFEFYTQTIQNWSEKLNAPTQFFLIISLPFLLILSIQILLDDFLFNLPSFVFGVFVFIFSLGPTCLRSEVDAYLHARTIGDEDDARHFAGCITEESVSHVPDQQTSHVTRAILFFTNERIFSTLFWFVILGPIGAVTYRLSSQLSKLTSAPALASFAEFVSAILAWIPARMLSLSYALTGNFEQAYQAYKSISPQTDLVHANYELLVSTGLGAISEQSDEHETSNISSAQSIVMRSIIVWVGVLAIMTLGGVLN